MLLCAAETQNTPVLSPLSSSHLAEVRRLEPKVSDADLVELALVGDPQAEGQLYRRHVRRLIETSARLLGSMDEAEDVAHDAFVHALSRLASLKNPAAFGPWLLRIAVRFVHRRFRRQALRRRLGFSNDTDWDSLTSDELAPDERAILHQTAQRMARVPPRIQLAWMLRRFEGFSLQECAFLCGCSLATVKRRVAKGDASVASIRKEALR